MSSDREEIARLREALQRSADMIVAARNDTRAIRVELDAANAQVATLTQERDEARAERRAARLDRDAAEAIIAGRTVPPTIREARQHSHVTRGAFVALLGSSPAHLSARIATGLQRFDATPQLWIALGADGRPCAWPVVDVSDNGDIADIFSVCHKMNFYMKFSICWQLNLN